MRPAVSIVVLFALLLCPTLARANGMAYGRVVAAVDRELAKPQWREVLEISLGTVHRGSRVASALERTHYVRYIRGTYRFTRTALTESAQCDVPDAACRLFPFGNVTRAGRPLLATLYSPKTAFNEAVWTYWFTYLVVPQTAFASRAARDGLVDTISANDTRCPAVWSLRMPLLANASVGPDLPFQIEIKSHVFLHGAIASPKAKSDLVCDFAAFEMELQQTR